MNREKTETGKLDQNPPIIMHNPTMMIDGSEKCSPAGCILNFRVCALLKGAIRQ